MDATRMVTIRPFARAGVMGAALAAGLLALTPIQAGAAAVIGSANGTIGCNGNMDTVQLTASGVSYAVPAGGGVLTSWSTKAISNLGPAGLLVWRPTATAGTYTLVAATAPVALVAGMNTFNLTTPIPVQAGDVLGLRTQGRTDCIATASTGDLIGYKVGTTPAVGAQETFATDPLALTLDVSATVGTVTPPSGGGGGVKPPTGGGTGGGETGGGQTGGGRTGGGNDQSGDTPDPTHHKTHHRKVKGEPTDAHSASEEAIFIDLV